MAGNPVRWGILGTGGIATTFVTDLRLTDSGVAVAVGSRSQGSADRFADEFGIANRHASYESLVADPDVDVIYVATPHPMHHDNAILALRAGKPVLVEKPFTMNAAEAREVVRVSREHGLFAMEAMWTRFLPHVAIIRDWLARGVLGDIVTVTADHGQWFAEDPGFRLFAPELGGGALLDLGVYPVSFASMVLGPPSRIVSMSDPAFTGVDAQTSMLFGYDSGAQAVLTCTLRAKSPTRAAIVGSDARIEVDGAFYAPAAVTLIPRKGDPTRVESRARGPRPAPPGRRGRAPAGRRRRGEPADATRRDHLNHGDDGHGAGSDRSGIEKPRSLRSPRVTGMDITINAAFLPHNDPDASLAFYRDTLGFEVRNDVGYGGMHWITVGPAGQPGTSIVLYPPGADPGITDDERRTIAEMMAKGTYGIITLATKDLDGVFARLQAGDAEVVQEPTEQPYGIRDCAFRDPAGNLIRINQLR